MAFLKETSMAETPLRQPMSKYDLHNYKGVTLGWAVSVSAGLTTPKA